MKYTYLFVCYIGTKCFHNLIVGPNILKCHIKPIVGKDESAREGEKTELRLLQRHSSQLMTC